MKLLSEVYILTITLFTLILPLVAIRSEVVDQFLGGSSFIDLKSSIVDLQSEYRKHGAEYQRVLEEEPVLRKNMFPRLGRWDPTKDDPRNWRNWVHVICFAVVSTTLICVCCCRKKPEDASEALQARTHPDSKSPEGQLRELKTRKAKLLVNQVVNKQRLVKTMAAIEDAQRVLEDQHHAQVVEAAPTEQPAEPVEPATLAAEVDAGQTRIEITNTAGLKAGDIVKIGATGEVCIIDEVAEQSIVVKAPLEDAYEAGASVQKDLGASTLQEVTPVGSNIVVLNSMLEGLKVGDDVIIGSGDAIEKGTVAAMEEATITTAQPLVNEHAVGTVVKKARGVHRRRMSQAEVERMAWEAEKGTELMAQRGLLTALSYAAPYAMQGKKVYETVDKRMMLAREKAAGVFMDEMKSLGKDVAETLDMGDAAQFSALQNLELPAIALLVASAFAPAQLRYHYYMDQQWLLLKVLCLLLGGTVLFFDWNAQCPTVGWFAWSLPATTYKQVNDDIFMWFAFDCFVCGISFMIRVSFMLSIEKTLEEIEKPPPNVVVDSPLQALRELTDYYITTGGEALLKLDNLLTSNLYAMANWSCVFDFFWMIWGTNLMLNTKWVECRRWELVTLRIRVFIFLILFIPYLSVLIGFFASRYVSKGNFNVAIMTAADSIDEVLQLGFPLARVMAHATLVRDAGDMVSMELRVQIAERSRLEAQQQEQAAALAVVAKEQTTIEQKIEVLQQRQLENRGKSRDQVFYEEHERMKKAILADSEKLFRQANRRAKQVTDGYTQQFDEFEQGEGGDMVRQVARNPVESLTEPEAPAPAPTTPAPAPAATTAPEAPTSAPTAAPAPAPAATTAEAGQSTIGSSSANEAA